jgi:hypothetical protein
LASPPGGHVPTVSSASDESMAAGERVSNIVAVCVCVFKSERVVAIKFRHTGNRRWRVDEKSQK